MWQKNQKMSLLDFSSINSQKAMAVARCLMATLQHTPVSQSSISSQRTGPPVFCEGVSYLEVQTSRARPGQIPESVPWKRKTRISGYVSRGFAVNHTLLQTCSIWRRGTIAALGMRKQDPKNVLHVVSNKWGFQFGYGWLPRLDLPTSLSLSSFPVFIISLVITLFSGYSPWPPRPLPRMGRKWGRSCFLFGGPSKSFSRMAASLLHQPLNPKRFSKNFLGDKLKKKKKIRNSVAVAMSFLFP